MKSLFLALALLCPSFAPAAGALDNFGNRIAAVGVSYTTLSQVTMTSNSLNSSTFYLSQSAKATVKIDNKGTTGTVYAMFSALSYVASTMNTAAGNGMEVVLTGTEVTWKVEDGTWPLGYPYLFIINAAGFKVPLKNTF